MLGPCAEEAARQPGGSERLELQRGGVPAAKRGASMRSLLLLLAFCLIGASCTSDGAEPYVRMRDPAPAPLADEGGALVAFWGSWCPPCVEESPSLLSLARNAPGGLRVIVVPVDEDPLPARSVFGEHVEIRADPGRELVEALRVGELPVAFLVVDGRVVGKFAGKRTWDGKPVRQTLARLMAGSR